MKKTATTLILTCCLHLLALQFAFAQAGALDLTFGTGGKVLTDFVTRADFGEAIAIQSDGKIIVAGNSYDGAYRDFALARYNPDGSLDNTFSTDGKVTTRFGNAYSEIHGIAIQADGKIVAVGHLIETQFAVALARYNTDGSLDNTFDADGRVTTMVTANDYGGAVALQSDGKIVVAGASTNATSFQCAVYRYNSNGSLDNSFDSDGYVISVSGTEGQFNAVAIQNDGKIVAGGRSNSNGNNMDFLVARYNSNGSADNSFDSDGRVNTAFGSADDYALSLKIQPDAKIVVSGSSDAAFYDFAVARYNANGSLDNSFSGDGKVTTDIGSFSNDNGHSLQLQADGKIIVAGASESHPIYSFSVVRYNSNGTLDNLFDVDGKLRTTFGGPYDEGRAVAIQSDGKIVVAGQSQDTSGQGNFALARYLWVCAFIGFTQNLTLSSGQSVTVGTNVYTTTGTYVDTLLAANGCDSVVTTNLTVITGIDQLANNGEISIAPNPFMDEIILQGTEEDQEVALLDVHGRILMRSRTSGIQTRLHTIALPNGIYFLRYMDANSTTTIKAIKVGER